MNHAETFVKSIDPTMDTSRQFCAIDKTDATVEDITSEDMLATFPDGSAALWINCYREWLTGPTVAATAEDMRN